MRREVLWRGSVGIRLAFLYCFGVLIFHRSGRNRVVMFLEMLAFNGGHFIVGGVLLIHSMGFIVMEHFVVRVSVMFGRPGQGLTWKYLDRGTIRGGQRRYGSLRLLVRMPVIVIFEIFENVADVQESVAVETDVHEGGLHTGEDAGDFSFVDAADESEFLLALDVNFD
jgi:hypothetical protein